MKTEQPKSPSEIVPDGYVKQRRVVCAAHRSRITGQIVLGVRHYDRFIRQQLFAQRQDGKPLRPPKRRSGWENSEQGFVDQRGVFLNRQEAWKVAEAAGQIIHRDFDNGTLYSENLY